MNRSKKVIIQLFTGNYLDEKRDFVQSVIDEYGTNEFWIKDFAEDTDGKPLANRFSLFRSVGDASKFWKLFKRMEKEQTFTTT